MATTKRDALARFRKAFTAHKNGQITVGELHKVEVEVLEVPGVTTRNINEIKTEIRDSQTRKNTKGGAGVVR